MFMVLNAHFSEAVNLRLFGINITHTLASGVAILPSLMSLCIFFYICLSIYILVPLHCE